MKSQLSPSLEQALPALDLHAHIDPTVTAAQLGTLGTAIVFAVTRTLEEAAQASTRSDERVLWGVGVHPGLADELNSFDGSAMLDLVDHLDFVGEVGLDRRVKEPASLKVLAAAIASAQGSRKLCSVHSTGRQSEVVDVVASNGSGVILHWFTGSGKLIERAVAAGCFFSVNAAMSSAQLAALPPDRLLPETDFPFTKKAGSKLPGDIEALEQRCSDLLGLSRDEIRQMWYRNLRTALLATGASLSQAPKVLRRPLAIA